MHDETVVFVHIPKTAGTTLHHIIDQQYPPHLCYWIKRHDVGVEEFKSQSAARRAELRMVRGHIPYGLHEYIPGPVAYFTILRQPIERLISYYYFVRREPEHYLHDYANTQGVTLQHYVESRASLQTDNFQTRLISGIWTDVEYGKCEQEMLALAKHNLAEHFAVVGLTKRFDETLLLLKRAFGWKDIYYERQNVTQGRPRKEEISAETLAVLREHNRLDLELYAYAEDLFERQVREQGVFFNLAVRKFQNMNRRIPPLLDAFEQARRFSVRTWMRNLWNASSSKDKGR